MASYTFVIAMYVFIAPSYRLSRPNAQNLATQVLLCATRFRLLLCMLLTQAPLVHVLTTLCAGTCSRYMFGIYAPMHPCEEVVDFDIDL